MILRVNKVGVQTSLLKLHLYELLNLLQLGLLNCGLVLLIENLLINTSSIKGYRLHSCNLHSYKVTLLSSRLVGLYHGAQGILTHVVVNLDVLTFECQVAVKLHLLTSDTRALCHSLLSGLTIDVERLYSLNILSLSSDSSVEDALSQSDKVGTVGHEVGLALQGEHGSKAINALYEYTTIRSLTVATLSSDSEATLTEELLSLVEVALSLSQSLLNVGQTSTGHCAKLLDIVN